MVLSQRVTTQVSPVMSPNAFTNARICQSEDPDIRILKITPLVAAQNL